MTAITIGLPVYNEGELLRGSLENLAAQTHKNFKVLIFDNASTDNTGDVARAFAVSDPRFQYFRQNTNKGALPNFYDSLKAANTDYFLWRAADDRSDEKYLEILSGLLDADSSKSLAIGLVESSDLDGGHKKITSVPVISGGAANWAGRMRLARSSHASWIYGLFRHEPLLRRMQLVMDVYAYPWGFDHLVLFDYIINDAIAASPDTTFKQVIKRSRASRIENASQNVKRVKPDPSLMQNLRERFYTQVCKDIRTSESNPLTLALLDAALWFYTGKRVYKYRKLLTRRLTG